MLFKPFSNLKFSLQLLSVSEVGAGAFSHAEVVNNDFSNQWGIMNLMEMWIKTYELCGATLRCFFGGCFTAKLQKCLWTVKNFP